MCLCGDDGVVGGDFEAIVDRVLGAAARPGRVLVAIDGVGASGKSTFAARLARQGDARPVVVLHVDDFFNPSQVRHAKGRYAPEGFWLDSYNYEALIASALRPLAVGGNGLYSAASFDPMADRVVLSKQVRAPDDALVLVEGTFLHRDELVQFWDYSIYLDVPFAEAARRMARRNGVDADPEPGLTSRYDRAQRVYFDAAAPWSRASLVVDNTDFHNPKIIGPDQVSATR